MRTSLVDCLSAALFACVLLRVALMPGTCDTLMPSLFRNLHSRAGRSEDMPSGPMQHSQPAQKLGRCAVQNRRPQFLVARAQAWLLSVTAALSLGSHWRRKSASWSPHGSGKELGSHLNKSVPTACSWYWPSAPLLYSSTMMRVGGSDALCDTATWPSPSAVTTSASLSVAAS